jgi:tRNA G10  N-methylase Trm11
VMDPFVGTGGLLIPAAHYKARCFGSDIDARVVFGTEGWASEFGESVL